MARVRSGAGLRLRQDGVGQGDSGRGRGLLGGKISGHLGKGQGPVGCGSPRQALGGRQAGDTLIRKQEAQVSAGYIH